MPSNTLGWTRSEIISKVLDTVGRSGDITLQTRLKEDINFALLQFWKHFKWRFGQKSGVDDSCELTLVAGQAIYTLNTTTIGYEMRGRDIAKIYATNVSYARDLKRVSLRDIRIDNPSNDDTGFPEVYAVVDHNRIVVHPIPDATANSKKLYLDGKVMPTFMTLDADYPDIPIEYQETFIQYLLYKTLSRERDPAADKELLIYKDMLKGDVQADLSDAETNQRVKMADEELVNSNSTKDIGTILWNQV